MRGFLRYSISSLQLGLCLILLWISLDIIFPFKIEEDYSTSVFAEDGKLLHSYLNSSDKWRLKVNLNESSPDFLKFLLLKEDQYFYYHPGVNVISIVKATYRNLVRAKRISGASTITMQLARLEEKRPRTYLSKMIEIFRATQLEQKYSKDKILELYINRLPYGSNIEGIESACRFYLQKGSSKLTLSEATALISIPNQPNSLRPGRHNPDILKKRDYWLDYFYSIDEITEESYIVAKDENFEAKRISLSKLAPHFSRRMKNEKQKTNIYTSLNISIQKRCEILLKNHLQSLFNYEVSNACALVIENKTGKVRAYLGSSDFHDKSVSGEVDGIRAIRSPGSTLKPFLYGYCIEEGIITPKSILSDVPTNFGAYQPKNYDEKFRGTISSDFALCNSLNVPAVELLEEFGVKRFNDRMSNSGFEQIEKDRKKLGLSVILGGCGSSLEELSAAYCGLANYGYSRNLSYYKDIVQMAGRQIMDSAAAYCVLQILTKSERPDLPNFWEHSRSLKRIAWKTGTSYGRRDAWAIGFTNNYTIGVWLGNFNGKGAPGISGAGIASPLLFDLLKAVDLDPEQKWFAMPSQLDERLICDQSGLPKNTFCRTLISDYYLPGKSTMTKCSHLKEYMVDTVKDISYCKTCVGEEKFALKLFPNPPIRMIQFYNERGIIYETPPVHNPECERIFEEGAPIITSPNSKTEYIIDDGTKEISLKCEAGNDVKQLFWFVDDVFFAKVDPKEMLFYKVDPGRFRITCVDDKGRKAEALLVAKTW